MKRKLHILLFLLALFCASAVSLDVMAQTDSSQFFFMAIPLTTSHIIHISCKYGIKKPLFPVLPAILAKNRPHNHSIPMYGH